LRLTVSVFDVSPGRRSSSFLQRTYLFMHTLYSFYERKLLAIVEL